MQIRFDEISVPAEKLDAVVGESMQKIRKTYREGIRRRRIIRWASLAAIFVLAMGICFTNPVLAAKLPLVGHIFKMVQDEQMYPGNFDEVAQPVEDDNSSTSQGVTITLSEIYSNKEAMNVSVMIETEKAFPEEVKDSNIQGGDDIGYRMYLFMEQEFDFMEVPEEYEPWQWPGEDFEWVPLDVKGEYVDDHTFIGAFRIDYSLLPVEISEIPETFHWKLRINSVDNLDGYSKEGEWEFETDVEVDTSKEPKVVQVNESAPNGAVLTTVTMTDYEVRVDYGYDESKVQPGYEKFDSVQSEMFDADGKLIRNKVGMFSPAEYNLSRITVYYYATPTEADYQVVQEKVQDESFKDELIEYMENISIQKTVINLE